MAIVAGKSYSRGSTDQMQQPQSAGTAQPPSGGSSTAAEAPPKKVAMAMDRLTQAARLIADIRLGADRLLEALFVAAQPHQSTKPLHLFLNEDTSMRQHLQDLRIVGILPLSLRFSFLSDCNFVKSKVI